MKFILFTAFFIAQIFANSLNFTTLQSDFVQNLINNESKVSYKGKFAVTKDKAFWHYKEPSEKKIYFNENEVVMIEPELEQILITTINDAPNLASILASATEISQDKFVANFDGVSYVITIENSLPRLISYKDKFDNQVIIQLENVKKDAQISQSTFNVPSFPPHYDIIRQ